MSDLAIREAPSDIARWWRDGHTRTVWLMEWQKGDFADPGFPPLFFANDTQSLNSWADYNLWLLLGKVSDTLIILIAVVTIITIGLALTP